MAPRPDGEPAKPTLPAVPESEPELPNPIGVPPDYVVERDKSYSHTSPSPDGGRSTRRTRTEKRTYTPRYFEGYDWRPASLPPDRIVQLQRALIDAGLIDGNAKIHLGVWDETSRDGYRKLLAFANASGLDEHAALNQWKMTRDQFGDPAQSLPPLQVKLSNPDDLKLVFRKAVMDSLGEGWDETKLDAMVASYQEQERQAQTEAYNLQVANGGEGAAGTVTTPPSPDTFALSQVESEDPTGAQAYKGLHFQNEFFQMLGGVV